VWNNYVGPPSTALVNVGISLRQPCIIEEKQVANVHVSVRDRTWIRQALAKWSKTSTSTATIVNDETSKSTENTQPICNDPTCIEIVTTILAMLDEMDAIDAHISALDKQYASQWLPYVGKPDHTKSNEKQLFLATELRGLQQLLLFCHSTHACYARSDKT
jgi:hypothetical protein